ncbi:MAG TPA: pyruvate dehydrogenase (acetyl-transferring) E1 component subunit alpha, partial [Streptomyces sp.]|nr:pyruvate dehydrogenase (acetyl-transferring) E1 component subunit alpha [Streptomyces sp.]
LHPMDLFDHVFAHRTTQLQQQAEQLRAELEAADAGCSQGTSQDGKPGEDAR